ncbi:hypothetical protein ABIA31_002549 [Catenulispora sp. MAP5-51]|uniref:DUF4232 domain-containing protein n=1 Tax=Catenulispora sp. MAP5-51 TaxID=3156298 RepID=UPI0035194619
MHRFSRSTGALAAVAAVSALTMAGCGSSTNTKSAGGSGTTVTTAATSSASSPTAVSSPTTASNPTSASSPTSAGDPTGISAAPSTAPSTTAGSAAGSADPAHCGGLAEKLVPLSGAASGNTFTDLVATNNGTTACTLSAQPDLKYLDAHDQPLAVSFSSDPQLKPYTLAPGASAAMVIGYGSDGNGVCVAIAAVRVTPPGDDLPFAGRTHCAHDTAYEEGWVAGTYSAPH